MVACMLKSKEKHSWKEPSSLPPVSDSHSSDQSMSHVCSWFLVLVPGTAGKNILETTGLKKEIRKWDALANKRAWYKEYSAIFLALGVLSLGSYSSCSENYFWFCRKHYPGKWNNKTWSSCFSFTSFCCKCWICLYLSANKTKGSVHDSKVFLWSICVIVKYVQGLCIS